MLDEIEYFLICFIVECGDLGMVEGLVLFGMVGSEWVLVCSDDYNCDCIMGCEYVVVLMVIIGE